MMPFIRYVLPALMCISTTLHGDPLERETLFWVERSKNDNIIQYDAQIGPDGKLNAREPVVAYWVRLAEQGQVEELSWLQETFAFGFDAEYHATSDTASMEMTVDFDRTLAVIRDGENYRVKTNIDGVASYLEKIYIKAHKRGFLITVDYIDIFGINAEDGNKQFERLNP
jgi:hypothetical protein